MRGDNDMLHHRGSAMLDREESGMGEDEADELREAGRERTEDWAWDLAGFLAFFVVMLGVLAAVLWALLQPIPDDEWNLLRIPTTLKDAQAVGDVLDNFRDRHLLRALAAHAATMLFLQTFAIPGTTFANLLGGALFGVTLGFSVCIAWSVLGSVILYYNSLWLGRRAIKHFFPKKLRQFRAWIRNNEAELLPRFIGLRVFPFTPNWFVNLASGQLHVPMRIYIPSTFLGLAPGTFVACQAGTILEELKSTKDIMQPRVVWGLCLVAAVGLLLPVLIKRSSLVVGPLR